MRAIDSIAAAARDIFDNALYRTLYYGNTAFFYDTTSYHITFYMLVFDYWMMRMGWDG